MSHATPYREPSSRPPPRPASSSAAASQDTSQAKRPKLHELVFKSIRDSSELFAHDLIHTLPPHDPDQHRKLLNIKARDQYGVTDPAAAKNKALKKQTEKPTTKSAESALQLYEPKRDTGLQGLPQKAVVLSSGQSIIPRRPPTIAKPEWHPPWKLMRVIAGHVGWVRCLAVEPGNEWFASGSNDRLIKIWDLASGHLKLTLTGHVSHVRGLAISARQPYLFSAGEDKTVKCWDLEYNKVIRHYHGHLQAVYCIALHPTIDVLVTGGRDSVARVWDMRTKQQIHCLAGHTNTVSTVLTQATDPQIVTGSHDSTIKLWDLVAGKAMTTLTHHKKSVRSCVLHPRLNMFASGAPDNIKQWAFPDGKLVQNLSGHDSIVNTMAVNGDGVLVSGSDNGSMFMWDWRTGYNFQRYSPPVQPGSIESEAGIMALTYDQSGSRLISAEADKTIKVFKEDETATPDTHPVNWKPELIKKKF